MIKLLNYTVVRRIHEGKYHTLYRAIDDRDGKHVVIKVLTNEHPLEDEIARLKYEYELLKLLEGQGCIAAYELLNYENNLALVMEDYGTESLKELISRKKLTVKEFLNIAIQITEAIEKVHKHRIIHKDINPMNILW